MSNKGSWTTTATQTSSSSNQHTSTMTTSWSIASQPLHLVSRLCMSNLGSSLYQQSWNAYYGVSMDNQWKNVWSDYGDAAASAACYHTYYHGDLTNIWCIIIISTILDLSASSSPIWPLGDNEYIVQHPPLWRKSWCKSLKWAYEKSSWYGIRWCRLSNKRYSMTQPFVWKIVRLG